MKTHIEKREVVGQIFVNECTYSLLDLKPTRHPATLLQTFMGQTAFEFLVVDWEDGNFVAKPLIVVGSPFHIVPCGNPTSLEVTFYIDDEDDLMNRLETVKNQYS